jgi:hypothetical protein
MWHSTQPAFGSTGQGTRLDGSSKSAAATGILAPVRTGPSESSGREWQARQTCS